jgi:hypothetical protein
LPHPLSQNEHIQLPAVTLCVNVENIEVAWPVSTVFRSADRLNNFAEIQGFKQAYGLSAGIYRKTLGSADKLHATKPIVAESNGYEQ